MWKVTIFLMVTTVGLAQDNNEVPPEKENENVTTLNLSNRSITSLDDRDFSKYPALESMDLSNNDIEHIPTEIFSKNLQLKRLNLSGNKKLKLPEYATMLIANIEELNLSNCGIEELPASVFDGLVFLKTIDLSKNPLVDEPIQMITLTNLRSPEKIILPHMDDHLIKELCKDLDITVAVDYEDYTDSVACADVRTSSWQMETKEKPGSEDVANQVEPDIEHKTHEEVQSLQHDLEVSDNTDSNMLDSANKENRKRQATSDDNDDNIPPPEEEIHNTDDTAANNEENPESDNTADTEINTAPSIPENVEDENPIEPAAPSAETSPENKDTLDDNLETNHDSEAPVEEPKAPAEVQDNNVNIPSAVSSEAPEEAPQEVPDTVDAAVKPPLNNVEENLAENRENHPPATENQDEGKEEPKQDAPMQRGIIKAPPNTEETPENQRAVPPSNSPAQIQENKEGDGKTKSAEVTEESSSTGTNVLVFLVIAVVITGAAAFGYKFYKSRTYQAARTAEPVERELKEVVVDKKLNGPNKEAEVVEEEPLMEKRNNSVEIKEIEENNETQPQIQQEAKENSTAPKTTTNEPISNDPGNSGPYMSTTTSFKPTSENKNENNQ